MVFPFIYSGYYDMRSFLAGRVRRDPRSGVPAPFVDANENLVNEIYGVFPQHARRFLPLAMFDPSRHQREQVERLEALIAQYPLYGLKTASTYIQAHVGDLLKKGRVLLEFAVRHNLPLLLHSSVHPADPWANVFDILKVASAVPRSPLLYRPTVAVFDRRALEEGPLDWPTVLWTSRPSRSTAGWRKPTTPIVRAR